MKYKKLFLIISIVIIGVLVFGGLHIHKKNKRIAYLLTCNINSERAIFCSKLLENVGFNVKMYKCIPNKDKILSNKLSLQSIYKMIMNGEKDYGYVFEDDIDILEKISLSQIMQYEKYSPMFFYLGVCAYNQPHAKKTDFNIDGNDVYSISGNVRCHHAIGLSKKGAATLLEYSFKSKHDTMDVILEDFSRIYPANIIRYDLVAEHPEHRGIFYQNRKKFPTTIW
jgi:hypothetical protein